MKYEDQVKTDLETVFYKISRQDDIKAFEYLFEQFFSPLTVYATYYIDSVDVCEDIVQDFFFKIWKNRKTLVIKSSVRNFLITSVKHSCIDYLRKKETESHYIDYQIAHENCFVEEVYTTKELEQIISAALNKLPSNMRDVFELNRFHDLTYKEIAEKYGLSIKTIESYMTKSLKILRVELKDYLPILFFLIK